MNGCDAVAMLMTPHCRQGIQFLWKVLNPTPEDLAAEAAEASAAKPSSAPSTKASAKAAAAAATAPPIDPNMRGAILVLTVLHGFSTSVDHREPGSHVTWHDANAYAISDH